jgi:phosphonate transport system permease protein
MKIKRTNVQIWLSLLIASAVLLHNMGFFDPSRLKTGLANISLFIRELFPPDPSVVGQVSWAIVETIQMAFAGTVLGSIVSIPLALLGARNIISGVPNAIARLLLSVVRVVPALLWAIIFVVAFGLGPLPGTLGLAAYSLGYLGKLYYEAFEAVDPELLEATKAIGCSKLQQIRYVIIPETANTIISQFLFLFEYNVRASTILGFVGAGGVGFYMLGYIQLFQYQRLMTTLLLTLCVILFIDFVSAKVRDRFLIHISK